MPPFLFSFISFLWSIWFSNFLFFLFDSVAICGWESMIPLGFFAATGYVNLCKSLSICPFSKLVLRSEKNLNLGIMHKEEMCICCNLGLFR